MVNFLEIVFFTRHLSVMLKSGITIAEALAVLETQNKSGAFKKVIKAITLDIQNGQSLAKALAKHPKVFNPFYINIVSVGEETGKLDESLAYLASELAKENNFRKKVRGALLYPIIVLVAALAVGLGVSLFILPNLIDLFSGINVTLPLTTKILLAFAGFMKNFGGLVVIGIVLAILLIRFLTVWKTTKPFWDRLILDLPFFGNLFQDAQLTLIFRSLGIMLKSGLTMSAALEIENKVSTNSLYQKYMASLLESVIKGKSLTTEFEQRSYNKIPLIATKMIAVGEETGKLDETFIYLSEFFEESVDDTTKNITTLLEPILLLIVGLVVGFIAISIITPIYSLTGSINP